MTLARYCALSHVQIAPTGRGGSVVDDALAARGLSRRVAMRTESFLLAPLIAAESDLVLTAPRVLFDNARVRSRLVLLAPPIALLELHLHVYWDGRRGQDAKLAWFREVVSNLAPGKPIGH
jgi:DNA-binding transcriptional LysR family regulator